MKMEKYFWKIKNEFLNYMKIYKNNICGYIQYIYVYFIIIHSYMHIKFISSLFEFMLVYVIKK